MDKYRTPEEFIRAEISKNNGTRNVVQKKELVEELSCRTDADLSKLSKVQLFDLLVEKVGNDAYTMFPVGVSSFNFQLKFDIDHTAVKRLARAGVIHVVAQKRFRAYGRYNYANLYSPWDYFRLTREEVQNWLEEHPVRKRRKTDTPASV